MAAQAPGYRDQLLQIVPDHKSIPEKVPFLPVSHFVKHAFGYKERKPQLYRERVEGYIDAIRRDLETASKPLRIRKSDMCAWMKRFLRIDTIMQELDPGCDVDADLERVELGRCPAVKLWFRAREARIKAGHQPTENEVDDWMFLPVVPYVDIILTDRNFREFLLQADRQLRNKVFASPIDAQNALQKWTG